MSWDFGGPPSSGAGDAWDSRDRPSTPPAPSGPTGSNGDPVGPQRGGPALSASSPPLHWLALSLLLALAAIVVHALTDGLLPAVLAWLVGGPIAIGFFAVFVQADTSRRAEPFYAESTFADLARRIVVVFSLIAVALNAWSIADVIARGGRS